MTATDEQRRLGTLERQRESDEKRIDGLEQFEAGSNARREADAREMEEFKRRFTDLEKTVKGEGKETRDKLEEVRLELAKRPKPEAPPSPPGKGGSILSGAGAGGLVSVVAEIIRGVVTGSGGH